MIFADADALLRGEGRFAVTAAGVPWKRIFTLLAVAGFVYGATMGSFGLRPLQAVYSGLKVPLLLCGATLCCLPSFVVLNTLLGLREDLASAVRAVLAAQGAVALVLAALAPVTVVAYASSSHYPFAITANGACFLVAAVAGQVALARPYRVLIARNPRHRVTRAAWLVLYILVAIQLAWMLRPYVGAPQLPTRFLREEPWDNAYVWVVRTVMRAAG